MTFPNLMTSIFKVIHPREYAFLTLCIGGLFSGEDFFQEITFNSFDGTTSFRRHVKCNAVVWPSCLAIATLPDSCSAAFSLALNPGVNAVELGGFYA